MSSELRASRSTALLSGIASSSSLPLGMLRCFATRDAEAKGGKRADSSALTNARPK